MADRSRSKKHERVLHNWRRLVMSAMSQPSSRPGRIGSDFPDSVPASLGQASNINTILQVANEIQSEAPNVSRILCEYAYSLSQSLDPTSEGRGVLQFKTGLMSVIKQKLAKKDGAFDRRQDIATVGKFYNDYREKHRFDDLQVEGRVDSFGLQDAQHRSRGYTVLRVLKDCVYALARDSSVDPDTIIPAKLKNDMESDAKKSEAFQPYNILPLEAHGVSDAILSFPEVTAARLALQVPGLRFSNHIKMPKRNWDILDALMLAFGFQHDNVRNQREHLVLLLANSQSQLGGMSGPSEQVLHTDVINTLFRRLLGNYEKWCRYIRKEPVHARRDSSEEKVAFMSLYLLIWGEAANVRFLPEGLCYIFHNMAKEFAVMLDSKSIEQSVSCKGDNGQSFLDQIITPLYLALKEEASNGGKSGHSKWRNYDDFNEFFWSHSCFKELGWPMNHTSSFFGNSMNGEGSRRRHLGKTSFVEHRTFFHLYHSFVRTWILLALMLQGLAIIAFTKGFNLERLKILLSLGLTYFVMKVIESTLDIILMVGAYTSSRFNAVSRIFARFIFFGGCTGGLFFLYLKMMFEGNNKNTYLKIYLLSLGIYVALQLILSVFLHIPALRKQSEKSDRIICFEPIKWLYQERYFVGRGLFENPRDYLRYVLFWIFVLGCKFTFSYFLQIEPLVAATKEIVSANDDITYRWHDFFSKHKHNAFAVLFLWAPVIVIYLLDISVWYTVFSAIWGGLLGARDHLGEIRSNEMLRNRFESFPEAFVNNLDHGQLNQSRIENEKDRVQNSAQRFAPIWNDIINCLREQDYITNREKDLLMMPSNTALPLVQWPLFLLVSKVFLAMDLAMDKKESSEEVWEKLGKDQYMTSAVREAFESVHMLLTDLVQGEGGKWFQRVFDDVNRSVIDKSFFAYFQINNVQDVVKKITALTGLLKTNKEEGVASAVQGLHESVYNFLSERSRDSYPKLSPSDVRIKFGSIRSLEEDKREAVKRLHSLLTIKESAATVPKNLEARRRLEYFTNSLFMKMPAAPTVAAMKSFCVYTPYYDEIVMYSKEELREDNEDGISTLFYLQKIYPDEWKNFLERIGLIESIFDNKLKSGSLEPENLLKLRLWASYRGQTLARTVRGMMYYRRALILQSFLEAGGKEGQSQSGSSGNSRLAKAYADLKFTYVITCQRFGAQKTKKEAKAADILYLMEENEALRIAYIDEVESETGKGEKYYYSKLVKNDGATRGLKDQEIYSIKLPGYPILGEGKPENQNHAVIFTRGDALQTIDMNQDNYFEEALKMRNLLQEFSEDHGLRAPTILGVREHVFTGSVSSLAWFMSNQETSFVTLGQRVLARPLKIRMHYGHPDVFDRLFHLTRGGFSKASKVINISEDIYAGFNSTLRQGNITHHEYIQVGKGRDVGLNQIAMFEAKVASGNGEQSLSRDVYRLGQLLDFFRMLSFFVTSVGYYVCTMMTVLVVYVFLYGKAYLALSGVGKSLENLAIANNNKALQSALDTQFLFQIGVFTAIPMLMGFILEKGVLKAIVSFITMQLQLCSVFFTFSLGTRTHYFGRTILHGGAKYRSTGRGFVVTHVKFAENYRLYSRSHFVKALEIAMLLIVYLAYGFEESSTSYILLSFSSWFLVLSWLFAPYIFNPSGFEWQKTVDDIDDWMGWLLYRGGVGVKAEESWEAWWEEEQAHIRHNRGRILETILSLRFFFFQYGVVYQLKAANKDTSLAVYGISWLVLAGVVVLFKAFSLNPKTSLRFRTFLRLSQGVLVILLVCGLVTAVALTRLTAGDVFASLLALIPTGWGILSIGIAWKGRVKMFGLWSSFRAIARFYDAAMGTIIFLPVVFLSWFPFVSTFQTRLLFNQAFSRGLEISLILAGNRPNAQA